MRSAIVFTSALMAAAADVSLDKVIPTDTYYNPRCVDGSRPGYYYKEQTEEKDDAKPRMWLIYLGGGGQCWDQTSCEAWGKRNDDSSSSNGWADTKTLGGIFSDSDGNLLAKANKVYAP